MSDISANALTANTVTANDCLINGLQISAFIAERIKKIELDPVFKNWLSAESKLSDIGKNEISDYIKKSDISSQLSDIGFYSSYSAIPLSTIAKSIFNLYNIVK